MDTDDLTEMAYAVLPRAHEVLDVLRVEIGASAMQYSSEDDLLRGTLRRLRSILNEPESYLDSWNYLDTVDPKRFAEGVRGRTRGAVLLRFSVHLHAGRRDLELRCCPEIKIAAGLNPKNGSRTQMTADFRR